MLFALLLGFAVAGMCSSGYRVFTSRLPSFSQLTTGPGVAFASVPLLVMSAPFLIMRNTILGRRHEGRGFEFVFLATLIAGFWSLMSGLVLVTTLQACGFLYA
jgi:hypothetical protein